MFILGLGLWIFLGLGVYHMVFTTLKLQDIIYQHRCYDNHHSAILFSSLQKLHCKVNTNVALIQGSL